MKNLDPKTRLYIIIGIVLIVAGILYYVYVQGKKSGSINQSAPVIDNPNNTSENTTVQLPQADIDMLVQKLWNDFGGFYGLGDAFGHDMDSWNTLLTYSDTDFVRVNNSFNTQHQVSSGKDFKQWVDSQTTAILWNGDTWGVVKQAVLDRLAKLNIQ